MKRDLNTEEAMQQKLGIPELSAWDDRLTFAAPEILELMRNTMSCAESSGEFGPRREYAHLKQVRFDLGKLDLTDRQLLAVSLVFYGGVAKARAARAMKISSQALTDHLTAALKKIQNALG